jgi:hypothetical protein
MGVIGVVLALASGLFAGPVSASDAVDMTLPAVPVDAASLAAAAAPYAGIDRIVVIVLENHSYAGIVNNPAAPYLNSLIHRYGLATRYTGVSHPSEPNYLALFSGSTQGVTDDGVHEFAARTLADQLEAHGRTWRVVAENVPSGCYAGAVAYGGPDGAGWYARKHEPAIMFTGIAGSPARCANITGLRSFSLTAADFQLVVPNMCHDMHDCPVAVGDAFLKRFMAPITASPAFKGTLVVITFDEGTDGAGGGGRVATVLVGPTVRRASRSSVAHNHYGLLRTIQNAWSLGCLKRSCSAADLAEFFGP